MSLMNKLANFAQAGLGIPEADRKAIGSGAAVPADVPVPDAAPAPPAAPTPRDASQPMLSTARLAEARRAGIDLNTLAPDELAAFAQGGVSALQQLRWTSEASARPNNPNLMA